MTTQIITDTHDEYRWHTRQSIFDADGFLLQETLTYDDGRVRTTTLVDSIPTSIQLTDPMNAAPWTSISRIFNPLNGVQTERRITFDDGRTMAEYYNRFGVVSRRDFEDRNDAFAWQSQTSLYNFGGELTQRDVLYDGGRSVPTTFANGVPTMRDIVDGGGDYDWARKTFVFAANGVVQSLTTVFDNGMVETRTSFLGPASGTVTKTDVIDRFDWQSIETTYSSSGQKKRVVRINDDGVEVTTRFDNDLRVATSWRDVVDAKPWATREAVYDSFGRLSELTQQLDEGFEIHRTYVSGQIDRRVDTDTLDAANWFTCTFDYYSFGVVERPVSSGMTGWL